MFRLICAAALVLAPHFAAADEIEDTLEAALAAYRAGDLKGAKQDLDYVTTLLGQMQAGNLAAFLPAALDGWTRSEGAAADAAGLALFGGGASAAASYARGDETVDIQIMADNQMVAAMGAVFSNPALMGQMGKVKRINRETVVVTPAGEVQALIDQRIMVQITGSAPVEAKEAYFAAIDMGALKAF